MERILCKLSKSETLRFHSIVHVAMEIMKTSNFTCQSRPKNKNHQPDSKIHQPQAMGHNFLCTLNKTVSVLERCSSYRESTKRNKERQIPTLSVTFTEMSVQRESTVSTVKSRFTDTRLIRTPHYYGLFSLFPGKALTFSYLDTSC